ASFQIRPVRWRRDSIPPLGLDLLREWARLAGEESVEGIDCGDFGEVGGRFPGGVGISGPADKVLQPSVATEQTTVQNLLHRVFLFTVNNDRRRGRIRLTRQGVRV